MTIVGYEFDDWIFTYQQIADLESYEFCFIFEEANVRRLKGYILHTNFEFIMKVFVRWMEDALDSLTELDSL